MDRKYETQVYMNNKPTGYVRVCDGQMLLYPLNRKERHLTTQSLEEVMEFYAQGKKMIKKPCLVPLKDITFLYLVSELERLAQKERETRQPAIKDMCQKKQEAIMFLLDEQKSR